VSTFSFLSSFFAVAPRVAPKKSVDRQWFINLGVFWIFWSKLTCGYQLIVMNFSGF
jgi:hypothetical protein